MPKRKKNGKFMARRRRDYNDYHLGTFSTYAEAEEVEKAFDKINPPCPPSQANRIVYRNQYSR